MTYLNIGSCKEQIEKLREVVGTPVLIVSPVLVLLLIH